MRARPHQKPNASMRSSVRSPFVVVDVSPRTRRNVSRPTAAFLPDASSSCAFLLTLVLRLGRLRRLARQVVLPFLEVRRLGRGLEAKGIHEIVGRSGATVDVNLRGVELVEPTGDLLAARLHLCLPQRILGICGIPRGLLLGLLLPLHLGSGRVRHPQLLRRHHASQRSARRLHLLGQVAEKVSRVRQHELDAGLRPLALALARDDRVAVELQAELGDEFSVPLGLVGRRRRGRVVDERRLEQKLVHLSVRVVGRLLRHLGDRRIDEGAEHILVDDLGVIARGGGGGGRRLGVAERGDERGDGIGGALVGRHFGERVERGVERRQQAVHVGLEGRLRLLHLGELLRRRHVLRRRRRALLALGRRVDKRDEGHAAHVLLQHRRHLDAGVGLIVLEDAAEGTLGRDQRRVEHVHVPLLVVALLLRLAEAHLEAARLVVGAIGARDQLAMRLGAGEPRLEVVLLGGGVVEGARDDVDHAVRDAERLVELLAVGEHRVLHRPRLIAVGRRDAKLLNLLKLVDAEDAELVAAVRARLLPEAR
mmetsp:Transcript_15509/g.41924  ORF Transcript_15509/g.41924 Transcript_15509/m.41924 type:complete len:537 (-) Transcript_15509:794-2404(-)